MPEIYTIRLVNCAFFARHGVRNEEEALGQRFFVDAEISVAQGDALERDCIAGTVDYGLAFKTIETVVTGRRRFLIEALALDVGKALTEAFPQVVEARITVRKPNAPIPGILDHVEVTVICRG